MDRLLGAAFCLIMLAWSGAASAVPACPRPAGLADPVLDFQVIEPKMVLHHDVDLFGLPRIDGHMERAPPGWSLQGITITSDQLVVGASWREQRFSDGHVCLWLNKVTARLGMPEQRVYVAADYPEGSCEYNAILTHERRHVEINLTSLRAHAGAVRRALMDGIRESTPLPLSGPTTDKDLLARRLNTYARPEIQQLQMELKYRNGQIDTPDAYRNEQRQSGCRNWKAAK
ncbi:MAG TPA: hypothetical protein VM661_04430 [Candidatus Sulfotelmatobacter sp.]|jgi:hypothetical protein|nr:hypothetical protein [Candidatus Sulfotelmatobacter sp.]